MAEQPEKPATSPAELAAALLPRNLGVKVGILIAVSVMVAIAFVGYVLYARGAFESKQSLVLVADNSEGVVVGMDLTFAGFAIGRVNRIELSEEGNARIVVDVRGGAPVGEAWAMTISPGSFISSGVCGPPPVAEALGGEAGASGG